MKYKVDIFGKTPLKMEGRHINPMDIMLLDVDPFDCVVSCLRDIQKNPNSNWQNMELLEGCINRLMLAYNDMEASEK